MPRTEAAWRRRRAVLERAAGDPSAAAAVDSGRFAEPFWYDTSPLTTPHPERPFPGRPPRGATPPVVPGVILADVPIDVPGEPTVSRTREIARDGLLVLTTGGADPGAAAAVLAGATAAPVHALALGDVDREGTLAAALDARPGEAWLVRPDGHVAA